MSGFTDIALGALLLLALAVELVALVMQRLGKNVPLITTRIRAASRATHLVPFLGGLLAGHFWWCP